MYTACWTIGPTIDITIGLLKVKVNISEGKIVVSVWIIYRRHTVEGMEERLREPRMERMKRIQQGIVYILLGQFGGKPYRELITGAAEGEAHPGHPSHPPNTRFGRFPTSSLCHSPYHSVIFFSMTRKARGLSTGLFRCFRAWRTISRGASFAPG